MSQHKVYSDEEDGAHIDDGLIEQKEKTLRKMFVKTPKLSSKVHTGYYRCPFCPGRRCDQWTMSVLRDHARALGVPGNSCPCIGSPRELYLQGGWEASGSGGVHRHDMDVGACHCACVLVIWAVVFCSSVFRLDDGYLFR